MNILKKFLSFALALSLMSALLIPATAASITVGQAQSVNVVDDETPVVFEFVPGQSGYYVFYSYNSQGYDPYGYIMDANKVLLADGDDTENGMDFSISCHMTAGKTYYLAATCYAGSARYTVQIKQLASPTGMAFEQNTYTGSILGSLYPLITFTPANCATEPVTLTSSNERVVSISESGDLCFGIPGTATVTATSLSGLTATCTVTVNVPDLLPLNTPWTLDAAKGEQFLQFVAPADGWYGIWSEGDEIDPRIEVLDAGLNGMVQDDEALPNDNFFAAFYLKAGQICYFDLSVPGSSTGTAQVRVQTLSAATGLRFSSEQITAYADTLCWLSPVYTPLICVPEELTWYSSNEDVVYVDKLGHASFLQPGKAVITVTSATGKTARVSVTVLSSPSAADLTAWGICGPNLQWQLDSTGTLTITGSGEMYQLYNNDSHWTSYADRIKNVVFPSGITDICDGAFLDCTELTQISIPDSVRSIGSDVFQNCYSLVKATLPANLEYLGCRVFDCCVSLKQVTLPENLKRIPTATFRSCASLTQITLPQSSVSIGDEAFAGCPIRAVSLPKTLKTIGYGAFAGTGLSDLVLPEGLTELRDYALLNCSLKELAIPASVTKLGSGFVSGNDLHTLRFLGNAPMFDEYALDYLQITAYYPAGNRSWTEAVLKNYGGTVNWVPEGDPGVTLSGTAPDGVQLTLSQGTTVLETITSENGSYAFFNLQPGTYTVTVSAPRYVTRTYSFTVTHLDVIGNIALHLIGDVDGNGKINIGDVARINAHIKGSALLTDSYVLECANVNGGKLNIGDAASLYAHIRGTKKLY